LIQQTQGEQEKGISRTFLYSAEKKELDNEIIRSCLEVLELQTLIGGIQPAARTILRCISIKTYQVLPVIRKINSSRFLP